MINIVTFFSLFKKSVVFPVLRISPFMSVSIYNPTYSMKRMYCSMFGYNYKPTDIR